MPNAADFVAVEKVYKNGPFARPGVPAVRGVSLAVPAGCVFGLLGPNRAGKTTLVKLLLNLARPTAGTVTRFGSPAADRRTLGRVGYMHENQAFPRYLSAREVLRFYTGLTGVPTADIDRLADAALDRVGLSDRAREPIGRFSKGMGQRLGLAQAIAAGPDLLVLDEPTEGLDLDGRELLRTVVRDHKAAGKTVLLVSHVVAEIEALCDELAVVVAGRLAYRGDLNQLTGPAGADRRPLEPALKAVYQKGVAA